MAKSKIALPTFTATQWETGTEKQKFARHFIRFVESDFRRTLFYDWFYKRLSCTFGHIAHYDRSGFYSTFFESTQGKADFLAICLENTAGDPAFTYSDVEKFLQDWLREKNWLIFYQQKASDEREQNERAQLAYPKQKYEEV